MLSSRKASYKVPPAVVRDPLISQEHRRSKRRAERFDSSRQLDLFSDLTLGPSDDEIGDEDNDQDGPQIVREGVAQFAGMLAPSGVATDIDVSEATAISSESAVPPSQPSDVQTNAKKRGKNKRKGKAAAAGAKGRKPSNWADKCMYAELLEMSEEMSEAYPLSDGIPENIETGWVVVTPVPVGKRCLAITHQISGIAGVVPNVTLRSRVLGKPLMGAFPSPLPPQTILDCILDENWHKNGILHVLDVIKWKGQDVADCETPFRFWWRDTRLSELSSHPPPPSATDVEPTVMQGVEAPSSWYKFPYPTTFCPVPYYTDTSLANLAGALVPLTRSSRFFSVSTPVQTAEGTAAMDLDGAVSPLVQLEVTTAELKSDGMLLYVSKAAYEPGTSPLSSWIPLKAYTPDSQQSEANALPVALESPLDVFERLVRRRLVLKNGGSALATPEVSMEEV
ncbi:uncharacterized protein LAESUDRAFT_644795 [Laetiporus sulphureus 93-53]|uniref:Snurportin-1 n=1 Tax=Laetiporus sulphureus 93-53 TaxID=1314785 RepID=A0A165GML2_9APHY|nr:uncharacterized protein LAESUDRAFT_644795 [Laetiporus sulphureus 93-53]KZT10558.1 hypothetical protein LAESUDRAFT_644795 [Laetiporus sulphureus 93-53]